ncbi:MAG: TlpA family protein disulfide reductase [Bacteroidota bacterium]|jgi:thiol-disulfide isomerase/thioredoxin
MIKIATLLLILGLFIPFMAFTQNVKVIKFDEFENELAKSKDTTLIINFWATWCKPCVNELPCFYDLNNQRTYPNAKIILVSLDFKRNLEKALLPFLKKRGDGPEVWLLDEPDYDAWINKIDTNWSGAIPATLMINNQTGKKHFFEGEYDCNLLRSDIDKFIKK